MRMSKGAIERATTTYRFVPRRLSSRNSLYGHIKMDDDSPVMMGQAVLDACPRLVRKLRKRLVGKKLA
jgi:hypothetical protein